MLFPFFIFLLLTKKRWQKQLLKARGVNFVLKPGSEIWPFSQHEPLGTFIYLPLSGHEPWRLRKTKPVVDLMSALREVQDADNVHKGDIMREFICLTRQLDAMP
jgi:hypothetical protein